eukprot:TRINITY_DN37209_c0_g1_i1.p1 TRINITY_DN37209_c0_g1~~TRINITY_DN37209_c0_g1_i1.p1  ORF type:complete len:432 (-),score=93.11 TRINITY_DN37209_c0_g1_i1:131-1426(-)
MHDPSKTLSWFLLLSVAAPTQALWQPQGTWNAAGAGIPKEAAVAATVTSAATAQVEAPAPAAADSAAQVAPAAVAVPKPPTPSTLDSAATPASAIDLHRQASVSAHSAGEALILDADVDSRTRIIPKSACKVMLLAAVLTTLPNAHWDRTIAADGTFSKTPFGLLQDKPARETLVMNSTDSVGGAHAVAGTGADAGTVKEMGMGRSLSAVGDSLRGLAASVAASGLDLTIVFDELPSSILSLASDRVRFVRIDPEKHESRRNSIHMARFFYFRDLTYAHPEWDYVFMLDALDVTVGMNMCSQLNPNLLYVGKDAPGKTMSDGWFIGLYNQLGGKYLDWYYQFTMYNPNAEMLNAGISGGSRHVALDFLDRMTALFADHETLAPWGTFVSDMSIMNFVVRRYFTDTFKSGPPVNSEFGKFQSDRKDVWFIHK